MIAGIGIDMVSHERIEEIWKRYSQRFLNHLLTPREQAQKAHKTLRVKDLAAHFAIKEATYKALRPTDLPFQLKEIELVFEKGGAPSVQLLGNLKSLAEKKGIQTIQVSLTHEGGMTLAMALAWC